MLTRKQRDLLDIISEGIAREGVPPSYEEMKKALGVSSKSGIHRHVIALEERGFIRRLPNRARAIEILKFPAPLPKRPEFHPEVIEGDGDGLTSTAVSAETAGAMELPMMGRIAAGVPIEAISNVLDNVPVPAAMLSGKARHYALEVKGDSMIEEGINDGDVVVIREAKTADNGDIVVAFIEGHEATLKRFRKKGAKIALEAANPAYKTREFRDDQIEVQGRLVALIRTY